MDDERQCVRCNETKPLNRFQKHKSRNDTHLRVCRLCMNARQLQRLSFPTDPDGEPIIPDWFAQESNRLDYLVKKARYPHYARDMHRRYAERHPERIQEYIRRRQVRQSIARAARQAAYRHQRGIVIGQNKVCHTCDTVKLLEEFNANSNAPDGRKTQCRDCQKAHHWEVRDTRLPQIREYSKKYYREHKEELAEYAKEYHKEYYEKNLERLREYHKEYYQKNRQRILEYHKQRYQDTKATSDIDNSSPAQDPPKV